MSGEAIPAGIERAEVMDLLTSLSDRSLVTLDENGRYRLLETVRQYARDLLDEKQESETLRNRHLDFVEALVEASEPRLKSSVQRETAAMLESEHENIRAALEWGISGNGSEKPMSIISNLVIFYWRQGHFVEGTEWCLRAIDTTRGRLPTVNRGRALTAAGMLSTLQGSVSEAKGYCEESCRILTEIGDRKNLGEALAGLGFSAFFLDDYSTARTCVQEARKAAKETNNLWHFASATYFNGLIDRIDGDYESAISAYEEALQIYRQMGDRIGSSYPIYDLGLAEYYRGNLAPALKYFEDSLAIRGETNDVWGTAESLFGLGSTFFAMGEFEAARTKFEESVRVAKEIGDKTRIAICLNFLGRIALASGNVKEAGENHTECLDIYEAIEDKWGLAHCCSGHAEIAAHNGDWKSAVQLWSASDKLRHEINSPSPPIEKAWRDTQLASAHQQLSEAGFDEHWSAGTQLNLSQAIAACRKISRALS